MSFKYILKRPQNKAHKTLEYTLLLPEINTNRLKSSDSYFLVDKILMYTYRNCYCNLLGDFNFLRFFGEQNSPVISKMQETANSSYALNQVKQLDFFGSSILNQCIMSSYDICVKMLTDQQELTTYSFCKLEYKGFNQSLIENALTIPFKIIRTNKSLETEKTSIYHQQINGSNSTKQKDIKSVLASYATSLSKKIIIRKTALEQAGFNFGQPACSKMDYNFADILYKFTQIHENTFSKFMSMYTNEWSISNLTLKQHWDILENIHDLFYNDNIFTTKLSFPKTKIYTDEIYCRYKFERIFCFHSAIKLFQSIEHLKNAKGFSIYSDNEMNTLAQIFSLPNVFSRDIFLNYALSTLDPQNKLLYEDYYKTLNNPEKVITKFEHRRFNINKWYVNFNHFCKLFSDFLFPANEWYFHIALLQACDNDYEKMHELLSQYIATHSTYILNPFSEYKPFDNDKDKAFFKNLITFTPKDYIKTNTKPKRKNSRLKTPDLSICDLLNQSSNNTLLNELPIKPFDKNIFLANTMHKLTKHKILGTYMNAVVDEVLDIDEL